MLYRCYCHLLETGELPDDFNEAFMVFLPKVPPSPGDNLAQCKESETRPLSLSNTDSKILAKALMKLPDTDYLLCSYLIPERVVPPVHDAQPPPQIAAANQPED